MKLVRALIPGTVTVLAAVFCLHVAAIAQEMLGTVTATLDGEERAWLSVHQEGSHNGSYYLGVMPGVTLVMIHAMYGHAPEEDLLGKDWIDITFQIEAEAIYEEVQLEGGKVTYHPQGLYPYYSSENGGEARIRLTEYGPHDAGGWAKGTYSAVLVRMDSDEKPDPDDRLVVEGDFEVRLMELE